MDKGFPFRVLLIFYLVTLSFSFLAIKTTCSRIASEYLPILPRMMKMPEPSCKNLTQGSPKIRWFTA